MTNGGKDIKIGNDKRTVSIVPSQEPLYNFFNGEQLTDAFGQPIFADEDIIYIEDALSRNATSIVFPSKSNGVTKNTITSIGNTEVNYNFVGRNEIGIDTSNLKVGDSLSGKYIPDGTFISRIGIGSVFLSNNTNNTGIETEPDVEITRESTSLVSFRPTIKVAEQFPDETEVSTTLLGIPRAETQLSLFSDVASYGLDVNQWETVRFVGRSRNFVTWTRRLNEIYGKRYDARLTEETNESALKLEAFPTPYTYPYGPLYEKTGLYNEELFQNYLRFVQLGNQLYNFYNENGTSLGYPDSWKNNFLPETFAKVESGDVIYDDNINFAFAGIDDWTETWRDMRDSQLIDPVTGKPFTFVEASNLNTVIPTTSSETRPGYRSGYRNYVILQSKQTFRYQPGRISGFTFGSSCSAEPVTGYTIEFGIYNESDEYVFRVDRGDLKIVRRSTVPLSRDVLELNLLEPEDQRFVTNSDPFKPITLNEIVIPRDNFNGDALDGNGRSGYQLQLPNVTMYKIEFGWYGAIGVRFYAYIPAGPGEARWVVLHTIVLENQLEGPCLQESYFKFKYQIDVRDNAFIREPVFLYKYGSSYYIDGGDEGGFTVNTKTSRLRTITNTAGPESLFGLIPKQEILSSSGDLLPNNKIVIPKELTVNSDSLVKVNVITCTGCPNGYGYTYSPGISSPENGRSLNIRFTSASTIQALNDDYFYEYDKGAKIIGKTIWNAYIEELKDPVGTAGSFRSAELSRSVGGELVRDPSVGRALGFTTAIPIGEDYPYPVRLSNYDGVYVSEYRVSGTKVELIFLNPIKRDTGTNSGGHVADVRVGFTNIEPDINRVDGDIFNVPGIGFTSKLPEDRYIFAEVRANGILLNEQGIEVGEGINNPFVDSEIDVTTPEITSAGGGVCSGLTLEVLPSIEFPGVTYSQNNPDKNESGNFLIAEGRFPTLSLNELGEDSGYDQGSVSVENNNGDVVDTGLRYVGLTSTFIPDPADPDRLQSYIRISGDISTIPNLTSPYKLAFTPIELQTKDTFNTSAIKRSIFNFDPFPLFLVMQLKDNTAINSVTMKEFTGFNEKILSPVQSATTYTQNLSLTNAGGNADLVGLSPPNFLEVDRLSSLKIDILNQQKLRIGPQTTIIDTFYVGANDARTVDLSKIFGVDRNKILRNRQNNQAVFIVAENISSNTTANLEATLNYLEQ